MVTGQFPFHADTPVAIALQHVTRQPPPPSSINPALPLALDTVLLKGLAKSPADRFNSAGEFAAAFRRALGTIDTRTVIRVGQLSQLSPVSPSLSAAAPIPAPSSGNNGRAVKIDDRITPLHTPVDGRPVHRKKRRVSLTYLVLLVGLFGVLLLLFRIGLAQFGPSSVTTSPGQTVTYTSAVVSPAAPTLANSNQSITATPSVRILPTLTSTGAVSIVPAFSAISKDLYTPVNIRAGPSVHYEVIAQLYTDDEGLVLSRTANTTPVWYLIRTSQGKVGWVSGDVIDIIPTSADPLRIPTAAQSTLPPSPTLPNPLTPTVQARG